MPIQLLDTTITGLGAGGLPSGTVTSSSLATSGKISVATAVRTTSQTLNGDSGWQDHLSLSFTAALASRAVIFFNPSSTYEQGAVQGFFRFILDGNKIGYNFCSGKQTNNQGGVCGAGWWYADVSAGSHTILIQARNLSGTWITPYRSVDGEVSNMLTVIYYG
jgi:hypothetical protein